MNRITFALLSMLLSCSVSLNSMVSHCFLVSPEGKHLLILAELHKLASKEVTQNFIGRLARMKSAPLRIPIPFIMEMEQGIELGEDSLWSDALQILISLQKTQNQSEQKQLDIEFFDPRGLYSREIDVLLFSLGKILVTDFPQVNLEEYYQGRSLSRSLFEKLDRTWKSESKTFRKTVFSRAISVNEYLVHLRKVASELDDLARAATQPLVKNVLEKYSRMFRASYQECATIFEQYKGSHSLGFVLTAVLDTCADTSSRLAKFHELTRILRHGTDDIYFELSLLKRLMERLESEPVVCIYVGYNHAKRLEHILVEDCGYICKNKATAVEFCHPLLTSVLPYLLPQLLTNKVLDSFLAPITREACWFCKKRPEELKQCAFCKQAKYCNRECQGQAWQEHKKTCVKVVVNS